MSIKQLLILPHLKVNNANGWSSPITSGFPSVCALGGAIHALQRQLNSSGFNCIEITEFGIISHKFKERSYREKKNEDASIIASAKPLDKNGERSSFVPEIKCTMEISLICGMEGCSTYNGEDIEQAAMKIINNNFRVTSGDVLQAGKPFIVNVGTEECDENFKRYIIRKLMPGYALIERQDLMINSMEDGNDALDALLVHVCVVNEPFLNSGKIEIKQSRNEKGWIVPISTGYAAVSDIAKAVNQRDADSQHRFAESLVTLGEFKMLHRIRSVNSLLWHANYDEDKGIYCYCNNQTGDDDSDNFDIDNI